MNKKDRLQEAFNYLVFRGFARTKKDIAEKMETPASNLSSAFNGNESYLTNNFIFRFCEAYNNIISSSWLLTGEGDMLTAQDNKDIAVGTSNVPASDSADIENAIHRCNEVLARCETSIAQMTNLVQIATQVMNNVIQLSADIQQEHKERHELYDKMHAIQQEHIARSREWIESSIANIKVLREDIRNMIDKQTQDTEVFIRNNNEAITSVCRTVNNDDIRQGIKTLISFHNADKISDVG